MLRRLDSSLEEAQPLSAEAAYPAAEQPFVLEERPVGIRFYQGRTSFFHPYALLQTMRCTADTVTVVFADAEVILRGRGLHALYVSLARQRVALITEQGERFAAASDAAVHVARVEQRLYSGEQHERQQQE